MSVLTEADLLSALATEPPKPAPKPPPEKAAAKSGNSDSSAADAPQLQSESSASPPVSEDLETKESARFSPEFDESPQTPEPESSAQLPVDIETTIEPSESPQNADDSAAEPFASLSGELFSSEDFESALVEVDAAAAAMEAQSNSPPQSVESDAIEPEPDGHSPVADRAASGDQAAASDSTPALTTPAPDAPSPPDAPVAATEPTAADVPPAQEPAEQKQAAPAKGLKFAIVKKSEPPGPSATPAAAAAPSLEPQAATPSPAEPPAKAEDNATPIRPRTNIFKRLSRIIEAGLDAIHQPLSARVPGVLKFIGIWSICTIAVSLVVIFVVPIVFPRKDALTFLEQRLGSLTEADAESESGDGKADDGHGKPKAAKDGHGAEKAKKDDHGAKPAHDDKKAKKDDGHAAKSGHDDKKKADAHGEKPKGKPKDDGHGGGGKADAGHGEKPKEKPKPKPKDKKKAAAKDKPKDAHGGGH